VTHFDSAGREVRIKEIEVLMMDEGFWNDRKKAQGLIDEMNFNKEIVASYNHLSNRYASMEETVDLLKVEFDQDMMDMVEEEVVEAQKEFEEFEIKLLLSHPYDKNNAILELHPGAGGTESQDWAEMLYRMYTRWAERKGWKVTVLDYQEGDEAGIKSVSFLIEGSMAYGYLKAEKGVHRLVRISPFDSSGRRHTSFCSLDVMPQFDEQVEINIDPNDITLEVRHASGAGGQNVNKVSSAVRQSRERHEYVEEQALSTHGRGAGSETFRDQRRTESERMGIADPILRVLSLYHGQRPSYGI
jgi:peptide chain release factor 2